MAANTNARMDLRTLERAADSVGLKDRIIINAKCQKVDFNEWVYQQLRGLRFGTGLELCCGTGSQTRLFLERIPCDRFVAVDIANDVIDGLAKKYAQLERPKPLFLTTDIDLVPEALAEEGIGQGEVDFVFCSYGLYYSKDAALLLNRLADLLSLEGEVCVVGPFGENNAQLFGLLADSGVHIADPVLHSCGGFMTEVVIPHMATRYAHIEIRTMVNEIVWTSGNDLLDYWKGSIFYDEAREEAVRARLRAHFASRNAFVNEKHVMLARARGRKPATMRTARS